MKKSPLFNLEKQKKLVKLGTMMGADLYLEVDPRQYPTAEEQDRFISKVNATLWAMAQKEK